MNSHFVQVHFELEKSTPVLKSHNQKTFLFIFQLLYKTNWNKGWVNKEFFESVNKLDDEVKIHPYIKKFYLSIDIYIVQRWWY